MKLARKSSRQSKRRLGTPQTLSVLRQTTKLTWICGQPIDWPSNAQELSESRLPGFRLPQILPNFFRTGPKLDAPGDLARSSRWTKIERAVVITPTTILDRLAA